MLRRVPFVSHMEVLLNGNLLDSRFRLSFWQHVLLKRTISHKNNFPSKWIETGEEINVSISE